MTSTTRGASTPPSSPRPLQREQGALPTRAVFFDLDDTLADHQHACRSSLALLHARYPELRATPFDVLEREHATLLEELHAVVVRGGMSLAEGYVERYRRLFAQRGVRLTEAAAAEVADCYLRAYRAAHRPVPGALALLSRLRGRVTVGVISNHMTREQRDKLHTCGLEPLVDFLLTSEDVGEPKPAPAMFRRALDLAGVSAPEAVVVGDSWSSDIAGARGMGIRAIWFNRHGARSPDPAMAAEIRGFDPPEPVLVALLGPAGA